jgi:Fungal specific transcription factor domain
LNAFEQNELPLSKANPIHGNQLVEQNSFDVGIEPNFVSSTIPWIPGSAGSQEYLSFENTWGLSREPKLTSRSKINRGYLGDPSCHDFAENVIHSIHDQISSMRTTTQTQNYLEEDARFRIPLLSPGLTAAQSSGLHSRVWRKKHVLNVSIPHSRRTGALSVRFPPHQYSLGLLSKVEYCIGRDQHYFLRKSVRQKVAQMYENPHMSENRDPAWLCRWLAIIALGELYGGSRSVWSSGETESSRESTDHHDLLAPMQGDSSEQQSRIPGLEFFENAVALLPGPCEEPTLEYVETLCLLAYYSHSLNNETTAYTYVGLALRVSLALGLHKRPLGDSRRMLGDAKSGVGRMDQEHKNRVWWTVYYLDR